MRTSAPVGRRIHSVLTEAWHLVLLVAGVGVAVSALAALIGYASGNRGGHLVVTVMIALVVTGLASVAVAMILDPMGARGFRIFGGTAEAKVQAGILHDEESGLPPRVKSEFRRDDVLYAGGVLLILLAVLFGYVCSWLDAPPTNPFG